MQVHVQQVSAERVICPLTRFFKWQVICFLALLAGIWINEAVDFPALLFGLPRTPVSWSRAGVLSLGVVLIGVVAMIPMCLQRKCAFRGAITLCSYCRRVKTEAKTWDTVESYFNERTYVTMSHGVCPDCKTKVMSDYRNGRKDAGARDTIQSAALI